MRKNTRQPQVGDTLTILEMAQREDIEWGSSGYMLKTSDAVWVYQRETWRCVEVR